MPAGTDPRISGCRMNMMVVMMVVKKNENDVGYAVPLKPLCEGLVREQCALWLRREGKGSQTLEEIGLGSSPLFGFPPRRSSPCALTVN
eukprot:scaffold6336_cov112-Isochrysis_galbana.AAC.4